MKIAFLNPQGNFDPNDRYWTEHPDFGGQLVYVKEVAAALGRMGHEVDILTRRIRDPEWDGFEETLDHYPEIPNVRIVRLPCGGDRFLRKEDLWPHLGQEWVPGIIRFYEEGGQFPDAATTHYADGGLCGALLQEAMGIPFTFTGHSLGAQKMDKLGVSSENFDEMENRFHFTARLQAERVSVSHAIRIITSTEQERWEQYGHRAYRGAIDPADDDRFAVVPPGVNLEVFSPNQGELDTVIENRIRAALERDIAIDRRGLPVILASSRLDEKKNHLGLVRAFAENQDLRVLANLAIVVRGLEDPLHDYQTLSPSQRAIMDRITQVMSSHHLDGKVSGFQLNSQLELAAAYRVLGKLRSIFTLTALYEPFGLAPLEAMSCGLPVVVTQNGGPTESLQEAGESFGVLVNPDDPQDIARGLMTLLADQQVWEHMQQVGRQRVLDRYTWDRTAEGYYAVIEQVVDEPRSDAELTIPDYYRDPGQVLETQWLRELYS